MKLRDVAKGTWAVKTVPLLLVNAGAPVPGQPPSEASATVKVGIRVLRGEETAAGLQKARELAAEKGATEWKETDPLCRLYEIACTLLYCVCAVNQKTGEPEMEGRLPVPFFESVEEMLGSDYIGTDNLGYLHEQWVRHQDECSFRNRKLTIEEAVGAILVDMEAPDSTDSPLLSMGHATLVSCIRILGKVFLSSPTDRSRFTSPDAGSSP